MTLVSPRHWLAFALLHVVPMLAACGPSIGNTRPDSQAEVARTIDIAVTEIVKARCGLEERCSTVGPGRRFESRAACASKMHGETAQHLNLADCPLGVEGRKLDACVSSISAQDCGNVFDVLNRWNDCRNGQICYN